MTDATVLTRIKGWFEQALQSAAYRQWRLEAREAWNFYDGQQWTKEEIDALAENGQPAIVINRLAAKIDNITGTEVAGRTRVIYRSRSGAKNEEAAAGALSDVALYVAERNDQALEVSAMFKSGLVAGIGWLDVGVEDAAEGPFIFNRHEDEFNIVWDVNARRMDLSDARFVARERWLADDEVQRLFPDKAGQVLENVRASGPLASAYAGILGRTDNVGYFDDRRGLIRVVEVQYKTPETHYVVRLKDGRTHVTFDKKDIAKLKGSLESSATVMRVYVAYFAGDILLGNEPLPYLHNEFTLVPYVYKRHKTDGRPYGLVRSAMDPQRELNKRRSKAMHLLNTAQVIADVDAVDDPHVLAREAARPDGMILKRAGKDLRILRNTDLAGSQVSIMEQAGRDIQDVMGVFDESMGKPSNATSGVAIQQRQMAGVINQMFAFDALRKSKKRMGEQVLALIRQYFTAEMVVHITDVLGAPRSIRLNGPVLDDAGNPVMGSDGHPLIHNDVRTGQFDVVVEEVRDVMSSRELESAKLEMLVRAGVPVPPGILVEASGVRHKDQILAALENNK